MALRRALVGLLPKALGAPTQSLAPICSASNSVLMQSVTSTSTSTSSHVPQSFRELWRSKTFGRLGTLLLLPAVCLT